MTFAVIKTGGKQYKVSEGDVLEIEKILETEGEIKLDQVLLYADGDKVSVGKPLLSDAVVTAKVLGIGKGDKKIVFKYKNKTRRRTKKGHRQPFTKIKIESISMK